jgi:hypothetical protein
MFSAYGAYPEKERRAATWNAAGCGSGLSESDLELVRSKSLPCGRKRKVAPSLGPATRAARSKCLLLAVESEGRGIASGKRQR